MWVACNICVYNVTSSCCLLRSNTQVSGLIILCCGIWMQVELHSYLELSDDFSVKAPYVLVGMGVFVLLIGVMACCCTVHGQPALLYLVIMDL